MGKGKGPEKGRNLLKYSKGFDAIDFSKKRRPENRMVEADQLDTRTAEERAKQSKAHYQKRVK